MKSINILSFASATQLRHVSCSHAPSSTAWLTLSWRAVFWKRLQCRICALLFRNLFFLKHRSRSYVHIQRLDTCFNQVSSNLPIACGRPSHACVLSYLLAEIEVFFVFQANEVFINVELFENKKIRQAKQKAYHPQDGRGEVHIAMIGGRLQ